MANLIGKWELEKSENFEEFLVTLDLPEAIRNIVASIKPTIVVSQDGDSWSVLTIMPGAKNHDVKFKDGVEFEEESLTGNKAKALIRIESPNKISQQVFNPETNALVMTVNRELVDGKFVQTVSHKGVTSARTFARSA